MLAVVAFVLQHKCSRGSDGFSDIISDFLVQDITIATACQWSPSGSTSLLDFVWTRSLRDATGSLWSFGKLLHTERYYYRWEFSRALTLAVRRGEVLMVHWLLHHFKGSPVASDVVYEAAKGGNLWVLELLENGIQWGDLILDEETHNGRTALDIAADRGHWDIVKWLDERVSTINSRASNGLVASCAFKQGQLEELKWAISRGFRSQDLVSSKRDSVDDQVLVKMFRELVAERLIQAEDISDSTLYDLALRGDLEHVKWLFLERVSRHNYDLQYAFECTVQTACEYGHIHMVEWLLRRMKELELVHSPPEAIFAAANGGDLEMVQWLFKYYDRNQVQNSTYSGKTRLYPLSAMDVAAGNGHLEVLQFLHRIDLSFRNKRKHGENHHNPGLYCTSTAMDSAAVEGHLEIVEWLHKNRSEGYSGAAMDRSAAHGHLEIVKWFDSVGAEFYSTAGMDGAVGLCRRGAPNHYPRDLSSQEEKRLALVEYIKEKCGGSCSHAMDNAAANGNLDMMRWLHANTDAGCSTRAMNIAAEQGRLDIVKWLHENRTEGCTAAALNNAAAHGHLDVVKWLVKNRREGCSIKALNSASFHGHLSVVRWLISECPEAANSSAVTIALVAGQFEVALYLHALQQTLSDSEVINVKMDLDHPTEWNPGYHEIRAWLDATYPTSIPGI